MWSFDDDHLKTSDISTLDLLNHKIKKHREKISKDRYTISTNCY